MDSALNQNSVFTVDDPPAGSLDATFASIGLPLFATDLRTLPPGPVKAWFDGTRRSRQIGGGYSTKTPGVSILLMRPVRAFDFLIFVLKTAPIAPL